MNFLRRSMRELPVMLLSLVACVSAQASNSVVAKRLRQWAFSWFDCSIAPITWHGVTVRNPPLQGRRTRAMPSAFTGRHYRIVTYSVSVATRIGRGYPG